MAKKWNRKTHKYEDYELPENATLYTADLWSTIACASCGKPVRAADTFTSLEIHTDLGFGYMVCEDCYDKEWLNAYYREQRRKRKENEQ